MTRATIVSLTIVLCLGRAGLASGQPGPQVPCLLLEFSLLPPNTGISLSRRIYDAALQYPVFGPAIAAARDVWNGTNAVGRLGGWTGVIPEVNSPECPNAGQPPFRISALNFQTESCATVDAYTHFDPNTPTHIAFVDYYSSTTLAPYGATCPQCGTKSMLLNLLYTFSLEPLPGQNPAQFDIQSIMAHEFGHMLGLQHMEGPVCGTFPALRCSQDPDRNTMSRIFDGEVCERDLSKVDKDNANSVYPPPPRSDFNGDLKADILWRHNSGGNAMWLMNGLAAVGGGNLPWTDPSWKVGGIGDFNRDGKADILWRNDNGSSAIWLMDGVTQIAGANLRSIDPSWKVGRRRGLQRRWQSRHPVA